jgi:sugar lactone lactonase YvrE
MSKTLLCTLLACGLLAACNLSADGAPVGSKGLWVANGASVIEYIPRQMGGGSSAAAPQRVLHSAAFGTPQSVSFDSSGNLWVVDPAGVINKAVRPALFEFTAAQLAALDSDNAPDPVATITSPVLIFPQQSVFDSQGNLWVSDHAANMVSAFTASQLAQTGASATEPALEIMSTQLNGPVGIAFDGAGNLWVANNGSITQPGGTPAKPGTTIMEFAAANLPAAPEEGTQAATLIPDVTLTDDGKNSIQAPWALVFDIDGNLWSSNEVTPFTLVEFDKNDLATGSPTPTATIGPTPVGANPSLAAPNGMCLDDAGNLAAIDSSGAFGVAIFAPSQLSTGTPTPDTFFVGDVTTLNAPAGCLFGPMII